MEKMAGDVIDCLKWVKFGGKFIEVYRGLKEDNWILNDEADVKKFLSLSEFGNVLPSKADNLGAVTA